MIELCKDTRNKYQKAFDTIRINYPVMLMSNPPKDPEEIETMKELVDKATPKKLVISNRWKHCPNCGFNLARENVFHCTHSYCRYCGQALEWFEDDE